VSVGAGVLALAQIVGAAAHASGVSVVVGQLPACPSAAAASPARPASAPGSSFLSDDSADAVIACEPLERYAPHRISTPSGRAW
jgi:hypothetical protein